MDTPENTTVPQDPLQEDASSQKRRFSVNWPHVRGVMWEGLTKAVSYTTSGVLRAFGHGFRLGAKTGGFFMGWVANLFLGAAVVGGAQIGPGFYYVVQDNEIVRAKVTGRQMADAKSQYHGLKYFIHTDVEGKLNTASISSGKSLQEGCVYDFNLKSARLEIWPPAYSRNITSYTLVSCPGAKP